MQRSRCISLVAITIMVAAFSSASELGDRLDRELKGGWGVLELEGLLADRLRSCLVPVPAPPLP